MYRVLVLMSTYNGVKFLKEQLDSIINQEGVSCTICIRDDGSKDNTSAFIQQYMEEANDSKIIFIKGCNVGVAASYYELARIACEELETFDYYAYSDQDDIWKPQKIFRAIEFLEKLPKAQANGYCSNSTMINSRMEEIGQLWKKNEPVINKKRILVKNYAQGCTMVFNKVALQKYVQSYFEGEKLHDYLMALVCIYYGKLVYDDNSYLLYRQHESNVLGGFKIEYSNFERFRNLIYYKSNRNVFCQKILCHFKDIDDKDKKVIRIVADYKKSFFCRFRLLLSSQIVYYRSFQENILSAIRIIIGTY